MCRQGYVGAGGWGAAVVIRKFFVLSNTDIKLGFNQ